MQNCYLVVSFERRECPEPVVRVTTWMAGTSPAMTEAVGFKLKAEVPAPYVSAYRRDVVELNLHHNQLAPRGPFGKPILAATVSAMSAKVERSPKGRGARSPKASTGACSRVWS